MGSKVHSFHRTHSVDHRKGSKSMRMPGFSAAESLVEASGLYRSGLQTAWGRDVIHPAQATDGIDSLFFFCPIGCTPMYINHCYPDPVLHKHFCIKERFCFCPLP